MKVLEFRYFSKDDLCDTKRLARSRCYEYPFVLETIKNIWIDNPIIHNTWCGWWDIHIKFSDELENYWTVINSDTDWIWDWKRNNEFMIYDIMKWWDIQADITLCVSTLEHLSNQVLALQNLIKDTKEWWYLIITLDSPPVDIKAIEEYLWVECSDTTNRLNPKNSVCPHPDWDWINIVKLVIKK